MHSRLNADSALLYRARRMAKRSRAAAACLPCKTSKSRCSDYRPCARCKKSATVVCMDPPVPNAGYLPIIDSNEARMHMHLQRSAETAPCAIRGALGWGRSSDIASRPLTSTDCTWGASARFAPVPQFSSAKLDGYSSWTSSTSAYIAAPNPSAQYLTPLPDSMPPSDSNTAYYSFFSSCEAACILQCSNGAAPMEALPAQLVNQAETKAGEQVPNRSAFHAAARG